MANRVQEALGNLTASPVKEPFNKREKPADLDDQQFALASFMKKELEEMLDRKVGHINDKLKAISAATDEGFQSMKQEFKQDIEKERNERKAWQKEVDDKIAAVEYKDPMEISHPEVKGKLAEIEKSIQQMKSGAAASGSDPWANAAARMFGSNANPNNAKAGGKGKNKAEKRCRTLYFGDFAEDTKEEFIISQIEGWTRTVHHNIDEIYAFGKIAERGAARFNTEESMWEFLVANQGQLQFDVGSTKVYANPDAMHDPSPDKTKAVRKMVRLLIEKVGGDGKTVKKDIITNYPKGRVWYKDERVAEWDDATRTMKLKGTAQVHQAEYDKMLTKPGSE